MGKGLTYAEAGVDLEAVSKARKKMLERLKKTYIRSRGFGEVVLEAGHYASLIEIGGGRALALHVDGVGTKTMVASALGKYDTVGVDCVAMNVNDLICLGAEPIALLDYLAINRADEKVIDEIVKGLVDGALEAGVAIVGGETAVMPDLINGFDLAAMSIGVLDKDRAVTGKAVEAGDVILGLESSGIHSNGLTLARKVLIPRFGLKSKVEELGGTLGEELLKPTRIYVKPVLSVLRECEVHGLGHITGGSFTKLRRLSPKLGFQIDWLPEPKPIFQLIKRYGMVEDREMYRTFNMGVGFCVVAPEDAAEDIIALTGKYDVACWRIGSVVEKPGVFVKNVRID